MYLKRMSEGQCGASVCLACVYDLRIVSMDKSCDIQNTLIIYYYFRFDTSLREGVLSPGNSHCKAHTAKPRTSIQAFRGEKMSLEGRFN